MSERKLEIIVGAFVTLAIISLIIGVIWGKNLRLFSSRQDLNLRFENVRGLEEGDPVAVRGIQKGAVKHVVLNTHYVDVYVWLERDVVLYTDFRAVIESKEIMGGKQVTLYPGSSGIRAPLNRVYKGEERGDFSVLFAQSENTLARLDSILNQTSDVLSTQKLQQILLNLEKATEQTQQMIQETRRPLLSSLSHVQSISQRLDADSTAGRVALLIAKLDTTAQTFQKIGRRIEDQEGTLGKLVRDRELYNRVLNTTLRLDSLITDVKENPKKYLHVSVF
ncbi:MCE family protein [bacterium]|nr:MCE family protein [bacterium]